MWFELRFELWLDVRLHLKLRMFQPSHCASPFELLELRCGNTMLDGLRSFRPLLNRLCRVDTLQHGLCCVGSVLDRLCRGYAVLDRLLGVVEPSAEVGGAEVVSEVGGAVVGGVSWAADGKAANPRRAAATMTVRGTRPTARREPPCRPGVRTLSLLTGTPRGCPLPRLPWSPRRPTTYERWATPDCNDLRAGTEPPCHERRCEMAPQR